jgi:glycerophosphoryl diester phosphodiesterase
VGELSAFFEGNQPLVAAHRGFALNHPENTLSAFSAALSAGADVIETDVHGSRDRVAMVTHDPGLLRLAGRNGLISQMTSESLRRVDVGGETMPTLEEALDAFPDARFSIDVKSREAVGPTISAIERTASHHRVVIASFSERRRKAVTRQLGSVATMGTHRHAIATWSAVPLFERFLATIDALFLPTTAYGVRMFSPRMVATAERHGVTLGAWTINDPDEMEALWNRGVRVMVTDRTDLAVERRAQLASSPTSPSRY